MVRSLRLAQWAARWRFRLDWRLARPRSAASLLVLLAGCTFVPQSKFESAQSQNRNLQEQNRAQVAEIENLKVHTRGIEDKLVKAEEELAQLNEQYGRDRQKIVNFNRERDRLERQFPGIAPGRPAIPAGLNNRLAVLAQQYPNLNFDPDTGISKLDIDVLFNSGEATLKPQAERLLSDFAGAFQAPEARDLKIMVVGHTDGRGIKGREIRSKYPDNWHLSAGRALAVAEKLRRAGIPDERIGIAGYGQNQPIEANSNADLRARNRRVEIFVIGPETPIVGWTETMGESVYRR